MHVTADLSSFHILARLAMAELPSPSRVRAMDLLPDDLLADVLARLPPCSHAASRGVRKHWWAIIDTRCLLRADLLPLRLDGFFCVLRTPRNYDDDTLCLFFSRPSTACRINADLYVLDHCNGLLLIWGVNPYVINPATRQRVPLPPFPEITRQRVHFKSFFFLAYDPMVSPHYEIVLIPVPRTGTNNIELKESSEWPPSPFTMQVFSSRKWRREERSFVREGEAAETIADMQYHRFQAVYLRGALYVHCRNGSVMRYTSMHSLLEHKYDMNVLFRSSFSVYKMYRTPNLSNSHETSEHTFFSCIKIRHCLSFSYTKTGCHCGRQTKVVVFPYQMKIRCS